MVVDFFEELFGEGEYGFEVSEWCGMGMTARELGEIVELDFECERVAFKLFAREAFDEFGYDMIEFDDDRRGAAYVALESVFATD